LVIKLNYLLLNYAAVFGG